MNLHNGNGVCGEINMNSEHRDMKMDDKICLTIISFVEKLSLTVHRYLGKKGLSV